MTDAGQLWLQAFGSDPDCANNFDSITMIFQKLSEKIAWTALRWARRDQWDKVLTTLRMGCCSATVVIPGWYYDGSFAHCAARAGRTDVLRALRSEFRVSMDATDGWDWTPLACAVRGDHLAAVRWLLDCPETRLTAQTTSGSTVFDLACKWAGLEIRRCIADEARRRARWSPLRASWFAAAAGARARSQ